MSQDTSPRPGQLVLVPALITLAVTLLRLVGELQGWSPRLFSRGSRRRRRPRRHLVAGPGLRRVVRLEARRVGRAAEERVEGARPDRPRARGAARFGFHRREAGRRGDERHGPTVFAVVSAAALLLALRAWPALGRDAPGLRPRRARPGRPRHAGRHPRELGHALRRHAAGGPRDARADEVAGHRRPPAAHRLAVVHRGDRRALRDRGRGARPSPHRGLSLVPATALLRRSAAP